MTNLDVFGECYNQLDRQLDEAEFTLLTTMQGVDVYKFYLQELHKSFDLEKDEKEKQKILHKIIDAEEDEEKSQGCVMRAVLQMLVGSWSYLEAFIYDFSAKWVLETKFETLDENLAKTKIPFIDFLNLSKEERVNKLFDEFEKQNNLWGKNSIDRFEQKLHGIGLKGKLNKDLRKDLLEWSKVRNLIIHRAGIVDQKFINDCPWLKNSKIGNYKKAMIGRAIYISPSDYKRYKSAALKYANLIEKRCEKINLK